MIKTIDLSVTYDNSVHALEESDIEIATGNLIGIVGPNGAGKSTLIKAMLDIVPHTGKTYFEGQAVKDVRKNIAYVEQKSNIDQSFPINVLDTVKIGTYRSLGLFKIPRAKETHMAQEALRKVGMEDYQNRHISELSGGQFQRILIARVLVQEADYIFLDEPFVGIDRMSEAIIIELLKELRNQGKTIFIIHHDLSTMVDYFDELIFINRHIIGYGPVQEVFNEEMLSRTFGPSILTSVMLGGTVNHD